MENSVTISRRKLKNGKTSYLLRWFDPETGKRRGETVGTDYKRALLAAAKREGELEQGTYEAIHKITWKAFVDDHVSKIRNPSRSVTAKQVLTKFGSVANKSPRNVRFRDVEAYAETITAEGLKQSTVNEYLRILRAAFSKAVRRGYMAKNPMADWQWVKVNEDAIRAFTPSEVKKLLDTAEAEYDLQTKVFIEFAVETGGRNIEILNLDWKDVDFEAGELVFRHTKGRKDRRIILRPEFLNTLQRLKVQTLAAGGPFQGFKYTGRKRWGKVSDKAGLPGERFHTLRKTFITNLIRANVPLPHVQKLAGHSTIEITLKYYNSVHQGDLRSAMEKMWKAQAAG